jgi:alkylation response protein AidB-like acyl-CoA dehydrogenase
VLPAQAQRGTTGGQDLDASARGQQWRYDVGRRRNHLFKVIQHEQDPPLTQRPEQRIQERVAGLFADAQRRGQTGHDQTRIADRTQVDADGAVGELTQDILNDGHGQPGFPTATHSGQGQQAHVRAQQQGAGLVHLVLAADQRRRLGRQPRGRGDSVGPVRGGARAASHATNIGAQAAVVKYGARVQATEKQAAIMARRETRAPVQNIADGSRPSVSPDGRTLLETAAALQPLVRGYQDEIERERRLPKPLVEQLRSAGLYRMVIPQALGGLQVDISTFLRAAELIAEADGSTGWNLANNAVGQFAALSLPDDGVDEIFARGPDTIMAGTAVPGGGKAVAVDGGFLVSGHWRFGSGCRESQWMMANFEVSEADGPRRNPDGTPALYRAFFQPADCTIIDTWDMTGMRGTGSHDWEVSNVFVPRRRTVHVPGALLHNQWHRWRGTLYALPIHALVGPHHSVIATGIARAGIDALTELAGAKTPRGRGGLLREREQIQDSVARAEALLGAAQTYRAAAVSDVWETVAAGQDTTLQQRARCRIAASFAVDSARQAMDLMYRAGGTTSSQRTHQLARCWRDLHVVGQAASTMPEWYALAGRALLGLEPGPRLT